MRFRKPKGVIKHLQNSIGRAVDDLIEDINTNIKRQTPVRTGFARKQWRQTTPYTFGYSGTIIENRAPYIAILDRGSSRQAPDGIVQPVLTRIGKVRKQI